MDGDRPLSATSAGNTNFYLYGVGAIAEKTTAWSYSLPDGTNTPRQLSDLTGGITLTARYTPWGDALDTYGTGDFTFGYFGGVMDAATGLLYVGNGQYYDPATGRFLTRDAKPNNTNPYVPWDPTGAIIGPLAAAGLFFVKRKKSSKWGTWLVLLLVVVTVSMTLAACGNNQQQGEPAPSPIGNQNSEQTGPGTYTGNGSSTSGSPTESPTFTPCPPTPTSTSTPMPTPTQTPASTPIPINCDLQAWPQGKDACRTYLALRDHDGWWTHGTWNYGSSGPLSPQAFLGLLVRMEFNGKGQHGDGFNKIDPMIQKETIVRKFYAHCSYWEENTCDLQSANDIFSFIARERMFSGREGLIMPANADKDRIASKWVDDPANYSDVNFEDAFLHPAGEWGTGVGEMKWIPELNASVYIHPMDWGNISMILLGDHPERYGEAHGITNDQPIEKAVGLAENRFFAVKGYGDSATIMTLTQRRYWRGS